MKEKKSEEGGGGKERREVQDKKTKVLNGVKRQRFSLSFPPLFF